MNRLITLMMVLLAFCVSFKSHGNDHGFSVHDMLKMNRVGAPNISPSGEYVVFNVKTLKGDNYASVTDLYLLNLTQADAKPRALTTHEAPDVSPTWSNNGDWVYFLSSRTGSMQVWRISVSAGEAEQITDLAVGVDTFRLDSANQQLAVSVAVYPECVDLNCTVDKDKSKSEQAASGVVYNKLFMRHWDTWNDGKQNKLLLMPLKDGKVNGEVIHIGDKLNGNIPSKPFGGASDYNFSADGQLIYASMRRASADESWSTNFDVYAVPTNGKGKISNLTEANQAWDAHPVVSPDGKKLAYLAMQTPQYEADQLQLKLRDIASGETTTIASNWDRSIADFKFLDDQTIIAMAQNIGNRVLFQIDINTGEVKQLTEKGTVSGFDVVNDQLVYGLSHLQSPTEIYQMNMGAAEAKQVTDFNGSLLKNVAMGEYEQFSFAGAEGDTVYGYLVKPAGFKKNKKYPLAFLIHGGPQGSFSNNFHYRWNPQAYAGAGYVAVMIDFHGSTGYGHAFKHSISKDWGGKPLVDLQKGLAHVLQEYSFIDANRMCALGASYGGYMINWIAGQWPDGFNCLVNHDGVFDMRSMYYTTEELWFPEYEQDGPYYANPQQHEKHNPVNYVDRWQTPMLVIQGELDYRVPLGQSLGTFTALQRQGIESKFLYFPDENHWVLKPANSIQWHNEVIAWLDRFTKK